MQSLNKVLSSFQSKCPILQKNIPSMILTYILTFIHFPFFSTQKQLSLLQYCQLDIFQVSIHSSFHRKLAIFFRKQPACCQLNERFRSEMTPVLQSQFRLCCHPHPHARLGMSQQGRQQLPKTGGRGQVVMRGAAAARRRLLFCQNLASPLLT